jgi:hypothetical protein
MSVMTPDEAGTALIGTCQNFADVVGCHCTDPLLSDDWRKEFDNIAVECDSCGWWVETHETNDDGRCEDCAIVEDDEE